MVEKENIVIYQQRYETYRHLDKLRWQMLQIGIVAGSVILAFGKDGNTSPAWWTLIAVGVVLFASGLAMLRIGSGIKRNAEILSNAGSTIGDCEIPSHFSKFGGVAFWIALLMTLTGLVLIVGTIYNFICN